jgi:hypothetical protein
MSELRADTITASDGTSPVTLTKQEAAKAWSSFTGSGTPTISDGLNGSSITDGGTGNYTFNMLNAMVNSTYGFLGYCRSSSTNATNVYVLTSDNTDTKTSSAFQVKTRYASSSSSGAFDPPEICCEINGDLA